MTSHVDRDIAPHGAATLAELMARTATPAGKDVFTIREMTREFGVTARALRFYEERGLIAAIRTAGNQRRFLRSDIRRVSFVLRLGDDRAIQIERRVGRQHRLRGEPAPTHDAATVFRLAAGNAFDVAQRVFAGQGRFVQSPILAWCIAQRDAIEADADLRQQLGPPRAA